MLGFGEQNTTENSIVKLEFKRGRLKEKLTLSKTLVEGLPFRVNLLTNMSTETAPTQCMYHGNRVQFALLTKELRKSKVIPKQYLTRLASAVCSCRRHKTSILQLMTEEDLLRVTKHLEDIELPKMTTTLRTCLHNIIEQTSSLEQYCETKLLYIVYRALVDSSYEELTYDAINRRPKAFTPEEKKPEQIRMTRKQFECMKIRKLKKGSNITHIVLPMFARNIKKFKESPGYKQLRKDFAHDGLFVFFCDEENTNFIKANQKHTALKVYLGDTENFPIVKAKMLEVANQLQESEDRRHNKSHKRHFRQKYWNTEDFEDDVGTITDVALDFKESFKAEFKKKRTNKKKPNRASVLSGGHCLQCLAPFFDIHTTDRVCKHHPGYLVHPELVWSCCSVKSQESKADHIMHQKTGCRTSQHNWRPHKKHQSKLGKNLLCESDYNI